MSRIIWVLIIFLDLLFSFDISAQEIKIVGKVTVFGTSNLNKVKVTSKETSNVVFTDTNGIYTINCIPSDILIFEANGFFKKKISLKRQSISDSVNVALKLKSGEKNIKLATGYEHIDKDKLAHAIQHFESENDFSGYNSVVDIIKGRVTGVTVGVNYITIRGTDTFSGEHALIVVDGVSVDFYTMNNIPPSQIESIDVLKGASASSRYGSRGMGGVIVIKTKSNK